MHTTITETAHSLDIDAMSRDYSERGYNVESSLLLSSGLWSVTFVKTA